VKTLDELTKKNPESLIVIAEEIYDKMASRKACQRLWGSDGSPPKDQYLLQTIMFNMNVLTYFNLREAIKIGDVGRIEDLLPIMVYRFRLPHRAYPSSTMYQPLTPSCPRYYASEHWMQMQ
jgi:hypothetical protein